MTKVLLRFDLMHPLDERLLDAVARAHGIYGIYRVEVAPAGDAVTVEYDASRLTPLQVEAALHRSGIPVRRNHTG